MKLEDILEEIDIKIAGSMGKKREGLLEARDIICKHMGDGWIPVEERLPTMEEYQKNDGRFILDDGNRRYQGLFDIYDRKFKVTKFMPIFEDNSTVIAWMPLPEPYQPESKEPEERKEWKERILRDFMKKGER